MSKRKYHRKVSPAKIMVNTYRSLGAFWGIVIVALIGGIISVILYMGWREAARGEYRPWQPGYEDRKKDVGLQREAEIMRYKLKSNEDESK